jgi:hypothetical protein
MPKPKQGSNKMRKIIVLVILSLCAMAFLASAAGAYTVNLSYGLDANYAYAFVNNNVIPGGNSTDEFKQGTASAFITYASPFSAGFASTSQTASPYNVWNQIITATGGVAGPISSPNWAAQGLGYGDSFFGLKISKDGGDVSNQVYVTLGYKIDGSYTLGNAGSDPNSYFTAQVTYFAELQNSVTQEILGTSASPKNKSWTGSNTSGSFSDEGLIKFLLDVDTDYYFYGGLQSLVLAFANDYNLPGSGSSIFDASVIIKDVSAAPLPGTMLLLGSGLLGLAFLRRK